MTKYKKGEKVIIVKCINTIYETIVDSLILLQEICKDTETEWLPQPYYSCVANFLVNDNQKTICFRVDYYKLIHQDSEVNDEFINTLQYECECVSLSVSNWPLCPPIIIILGWWCSNPGAWARGALGSISIVTLLR